ncbi:hypothetical protein S40288_05173 [Stachybotrys chartarum IBT 40288]|nr:hypothetical protein S40288_05173 [Stachybotrys chartarum IBT 40288]
MAPQTSFALITGCSSGIGKELAKEFASKGVTVLATARRVESLAELTSAYENIEAFPLELSDEHSRRALKDKVLKRTGGHLDYLVNNAGTHYAALAVDIEVSEVAHLFNVNVFAVMDLCQLFIPLLRESSRGKIVQIGSVTRNVPLIWQSPYNASKAALSQYSRTMRLELMPLGIEVIEVVTGYVRSNILRDGYVVPEDSPYLLLLPFMEQIKTHGRDQAMEGRTYAKIVVAKVMSKSASTEIWEGGQAWALYYLTLLTPQPLLRWFLFWYFKLYLVKGRDQPVVK